jgi:hypothetical protein
MANISSIAHTLAPQQAPKAAAVDADGDNDGTKAVAPAAPAPQPQVSKPTATMGNYVNTTA